MEGIDEEGQFPFFNILSSLALYSCFRQYFMVRRYSDVSIRFPSSVVDLWISIYLSAIGLMYGNLSC